MKAKNIKKVLFGIMATDGSVDKTSQRFGFYSKEKDYAEYVFNTMSGLTHTKLAMKEVVHKKYNSKGYRIWSTRSKYLTNLRKIFYPYNDRKCLTDYVVKRLDEEALAHVWMCDGYLERAKNRKEGRVQNIGWFCLEAFPKEELVLFQERLAYYGISSSLVKKPWGFGYRVRIGGENLQKFISIVFPYILDCFKYKTALFYKQKSTALELPSAEHFIFEYNEVDDIVRHFEKSKITQNG